MVDDPCRPFQSYKGSDNISIKVQERKQRGQMCRVALGMLWGGRVCVCVCVYTLFRSKNCKMWPSHCFVLFSFWSFFLLKYMCQKDQLMIEKILSKTSWGGKKKKEFNLTTCTQLFIIVKKTLSISLRLYLRRWKCMFTSCYDHNKLFNINGEH